MATNPVLKGFLDYMGNHLGQVLGAVVVTATATFVSLGLHNQSLLPTRTQEAPPPAVTAVQTAPVASPVHLRVTATQHSAQSLAAAIAEGLTSELQRQSRASQASIDLNIDNVRSGTGATKLASISWSVGLKGTRPVQCRTSDISFLKTPELSQKITHHIIRSLDEIETGRGMTCA